MRSRWIVLGLCLAMVCGFQTAPVRACPYCKADAAGLATCEAPPADDAASFPVMFSGGVDFASSYYFRGYLQADHGPIMQPYLNVFTSKTINEDLIIRPYVSLFNSTHFAPNNRMADMSDVMIGTVTSWNGFMLDSRYAYYNMSPLMRTPLHEIGAKVSYDVLNFWEGNDALKPFSLKPFVAAYGEFIPDQSRPGTADRLGLGWQRLLLQQQRQQRGPRLLFDCTHRQRRDPGSRTVRQMVLKHLDPVPASGCG
jgi:hypothetical protein